MKELRTIFQLDINIIKHAVEHAPVWLFKQADIKTAGEARAALEAVGAKVVVRRHEPKNSGGHPSPDEASDEQPQNSFALNDIKPNNGGFSHYIDINKEALLRAISDQQPIPAICGWVWVPQIASDAGNDLSSIPACPACKRRRQEEAISAHQDAAAIHRETGDRNGEGRALDDLGLALQEERRFEEAISAHQDAAAIYQETGDRNGEAAALGNLGNALHHMRRFEEAISAHQDAAAIYQETGDRNGEGIALGNLGNALHHMRRFEEAISAHQDAAAIYQETGDRNGEGIALGNLGNALHHMRRFEEAISAHQDAAAIFRETGDPLREGIALGNLELDQGAQALDATDQPPSPEGGILSLKVVVQALARLATSMERDGTNLGAYWA